MKNLNFTLLLAAIIATIAVSCNSETSGENDDMVSQANINADNSDENTSAVFDDENGYHLDYIFASADEELTISYRPREVEGESHLILTRDGKDMKLKLTEAWANGGIYSDGTITWEAKGKNCKLIEGDKTTVFKEKEEL